MSRSLNPDLQPRLVRLATAFEGGGLSGDFDGQVASWGFLQWNLGQGTLQPLLKRIREADEAGMRRALGDAFVTALDAGALTAFFKAHVLDPQVPSRATAAWRAAFALLNALPVARTAQLAAAQTYLDKAIWDATRFGFDTERGLALCWDVRVQNGGPEHREVIAYWESLTLDDDEEWEKLKRLARAIANGSNPRWVDDVYARKSTIALGQGTVHGTAYNLERDFGIRYWADAATRTKALWHVDG